MSIVIDKYIKIKDERIKYGDNLIFVKDGKIVSASLGACKLLGMKESEMRGRMFAKVVALGLHGYIGVNEKVSECLENINNNLMDFINVTNADGTESVGIGCRLQKDKGTVKIAIIKNNNYPNRTDIFSYLTKEILYDNTNNCVAIINKNGRLLDCNQLFAEDFKIEDKKLTENLFAIFDTSYESLSSKVNHPFVLNLRDKRFIDKNIYVRDENIDYINVEIFKIILHDDCTGFFIRANCEVEIAETKIKMDKQQVMINEIIKSFDDGVAAKEIGNGYRFYFANQKFKKIFGMKDIDVFGMNNEDLFDERIVPILNEYDAELETREHGSVLFLKEIIPNGTIKVTTHFVNDDFGNRLYAIFYAENVSEKERIKALQLQREKIAALGELAGTLVHDFNNHMMSIMGNTTMIQRSDDVQKIHEYADRVMYVSNIATDLGKKILMFSKKKSEDSIIIDVKNMLDNYSTMLDSILEKRIKFIYIYEATSNFIRADESQLENAIMNLVINSRDAIEGEGVIVFKVENVSFEYENQLSQMDDTMSPGEYLCISVSDTGYGMDEKTLNRVFEPYFTTKSLEKGTGLGLPAVYNCVKSFNGYMDLTSSVGNGTSIKMYFPVEHITEESKQENLIYGFEEEIEINRIVLVDDDENVLEVEKEMFEDLGYEVVAFSESRKVLKYYRANKDNIKFVVLDIIMKDMNGCELYSKLKKINPDIDVIFISGYSNNPLIKMVLNEGKMVIEKPFTFEKLSEKMAGIKFNNEGALS